MSSGPWFAQAVSAPQARKQLPALDLAGHHGLCPSSGEIRVLAPSSRAGGTLRGWAGSGQCHRPDSQSSGARDRSMGPLGPAGSGGRSQLLPSTRGKLRRAESGTALCNFILKN